VGLMLLAWSGRFAGRRGRIGGIMLGILLVVDLGRANLPWIIDWDYHDKYATNDVINLLRDKPYEHRVAMLPFRPPPQLGLVDEMYKIEWAQHHFLYYNIQSLDLVQLRSMPEDLEAFEKALLFNPNDPTNTLYRLTRRWELTNTRYLFAAAGFQQVLNAQLDPQKQRFRIKTTFDIVPKHGVANATRLQDLTAVVKPDGPYALFEFTGALPRAKLFSNWEVTTNDQFALAELTIAGFDPERTVLVAAATNHAAPASPTNAPMTAGTVDFTSYSPKKIVLRSRASVPSILLLNDRFDPNWKVRVDGKAETLLRCNYLMKGALVPAGDHTVQFSFEPPVNGLYISLAAVIFGLGLIGYLGFVPKPGEHMVLTPSQPSRRQNKIKETAGVK